MKEFSGNFEEIFGRSFVMVEILGKELKKCSWKREETSNDFKEISRHFGKVFYKTCGL